MAWLDELVAVVFRWAWPALLGVTAIGLPGVAAWWLARRRPVAPAAAAVTAAPDRAAACAARLIAALDDAGDPTPDGADGPARSRARTAAVRAAQLEADDWQISRLFAFLESERTRRPAADAAIAAAIEALMGGATAPAKALLAAWDDEPGVTGAAPARFLAHLVSLGDPSAARDWYRHALGRDGDDVDAAAHLSALAARAGAAEDARAAARMVLDRADPLDDRGALAKAHETLARCALVAGALDAAAEQYRLALTYYGALGSPAGVGRQYAGLGQINLARGAYAEAERAFKKALEAEERYGRLEGIAAVHASLAMLAHAQGAPEAAHVHRRRAQSLFRAAGVTHHADELAGGVTIHRAGD